MLPWRVGVSDKAIRQLAGDTELRIRDESSSLTPRPVERCDLLMSDLPPQEDVKKEKNNEEEERRVKIEKWPWTRKGRERLAAAPRHQAAGASCVSSVILPGRSVIKLNDTISPSL